MSEVCVRVAIRIRPLVPAEVLHHHQVCVRVVPDSSQVMLGLDRLFSFDHAFGPTASQDEVYESCIHPLVQSLLSGCNATVFCYGQTGSGKTYTLRGGNQDEDGGMIDRVAQDVFLMLGEKKNSENVEVTVRVSYMELYGEELRDLLEMHNIHKELHIREDKRGNTVVVGAKEAVVTSAEELLSIVEMGNSLRHTGTTGMNEHSSRSHAILTIQVTQCYQSTSELSVRSSKLCLVDLAGSECAGKTGNTGMQLKESAHINKSLLVLGNVIRALSDRSRNCHGKTSCSAHIAYRDAKITRLLRDSLGGTAHTLMVACVSPSHHFVVETMNVLQFASKARHIRNQPGAASAQTEVKSCPMTRHPSEVRLGELEYEVQTLRELSKEKQKEVELEREKTTRSGGEGEVRLSESDEKRNQEELAQYHLLTQEAATLFSNISGAPLSLSFRQHLQDWQERLTAVNQSHQTGDKDLVKTAGYQPDHVTMLKLREELKKCQETLHVRKQLLQQKDLELIQVQKEAEKLLHEKEIHLKAFEELKERNDIQADHLVNQQILIDRLRNDLMRFRGSTTGGTAETRASEERNKRPHSVPLFRHSSAGQPPRKIHSSPPAYSLERVMAAFKVRGHLLLAEMDEKDEVYCPFLKNQEDSKENEEEKKEKEMEEKDDISMSRMGFRRSLNRTWTSRNKKSSFKERSAGSDETCGPKPVVEQPQRATDTKENEFKRLHMKKERTGARVTEKRIQNLSINMKMKEDLIKELEKTEKESRALDRQSSDGREASVLTRLSLQSQQVRAEMYHSLQHMRRQRSQLQTSVEQIRETRDDYKENQNKGQRAGFSSANKLNDLEETNKKLCDSGWLEQEEEQVLQKRAELQELEEELRRREEVLLHRDACLQQKNKLEMKMLQSSQALSQNLLYVSMKLESLEEHLQSNRGVQKTGGVTIDELEKERDLLKKRQDALDSQLKDNRVLTVEEEHSLLRLEEAIEALDAALEFKNRSIHDRQKKLMATDFSLHQSQNAEPAQLCDVTRKLKDLPAPEALELLVKCFNKVVFLREVERHLRLRCDELELHTGAQEAALREMESAMQRQALDADRRLTQQHRDYQNNIQILLQQLKEGVPGEAQQAVQDRLQHLEKELFFYKSTSRQLRKKLKELLSDGLHASNKPSHTQQCRQMHNETHVEELRMMTHVSTTYEKISAEQKDKNTHSDSYTDGHLHRAQCASSSSDREALSKKKMSDNTHVHTQLQGRKEKGQSGESVEMIPVRLCHRVLKQISEADLQVSSSATRGRESVVDTSTETMFEDSIEVPRNTGR
ncbi:kinesin-like protein KIF27 [Pholidichthys leucotaenia]